MKIYLTAIAIFAFSLSFAQSKSTKASIVKVDTMQLVKEQALKWFKDVYVESNFKDPYSYKPLETKVIVMNYETRLKEELNDKRGEVEGLEYDSDTLTKGDLFLLKQHNEDFLKIAQSKKSKKEKDWYTEYYREKMVLVQEARIKALELKNELNRKIVEKELLQNKLNSLSDEERNAFGYYLIKHDSHANNSYGGQVLGRYTFKFTFERLGYDVEKTND